MMINDGFFADPVRDLDVCLIKKNRAALRTAW